MAGADGTTIMLAALASVLVLYVVQQERKSSPMKLGGERIKASLGAPIDCTNVALDSPDFARCSTTLGSGRTVIRGQPRADSMNASLLKDEYSLGNPFAVKIGDSFQSDTDKKLGARGGQAFPFSQSGGGKGSGFKKKASHLSSDSLKPHSASERGIKFEKAYGMKPPKKVRTVVEAPSRGSSRSVIDGTELQTAFLGAAVAPGNYDLGASPEEMAVAANKLTNIDKVSSNTGGNLNLLHPL